MEEEKGSSLVQKQLKVKSSAKSFVAAPKALQYKKKSKLDIQEKLTRAELRRIENLQGKVGTAR